MQKATSKQKKKKIILKQSMWHKLAVLGQKDKK